MVSEGNDFPLRTVLWGFVITVSLVVNLFIVKAVSAIIALPDSLFFIIHDLP